MWTECEAVEGRDISLSPVCHVLSWHSKKYCLLSLIVVLKAFPEFHQTLRNQDQQKNSIFTIFFIFCVFGPVASPPDVHTKTTIFSTYKFKLSITIAGGFFWRKKSVSWKEWWQNVSIMSRWPVLARGGEGEESLTILEILSEQQSVFLKIYYSAKWIFECHDNRGEAQTAGKGSAWLIVNPLKHATLVCVSRGPCCKYDVLVAHCVGFCEKRHFAQMTCNINKVMLFSVFSTESRC